MPTPSITPASTRRFLPSSAATDRSYTPKFRRPPSQLEDDIDTSFEDRDPSDAYKRAGPSARRAQPHLREIVDEDVSDGEVEEVNDATLARASTSLQKQPHLHHFRGNVKDSIEDVPDDRMFELPIKRRRLSPPATAIEISSSPTLGRDELAVSDHETPGASTLKSIITKRPLRELDSDSDDELIFPPVQSAALSTSRFRTPTKGSSGLDPPSRPIFKPHHATHLSPGHRSSLPEAFSPSRRRGKTEYIPGGNADLVRSWILGIAAEEQPPGPESRDTFTVRHVKHDREGRYAVVEDTNGLSRLLVGEPGRHGAGGRSHMIQENEQISVQKSGTSWTIQLPKASQGVHGDGEPGPATTDLYVSVWWDFTK